MKDLKKTIALFLATTCLSSFAACGDFFEPSSGGSSQFDSVSSESSFSASSESSSEDIKDSSTSLNSSSFGETVVETEDVSIHFLELGNKYTGDCVLIDIGDTEILIDAGSRQASADTLADYIYEYCEDGILEYVIATHADQDHIAGFVGLSSTKSGLFYQFDVGTLIQFPRTGKSATTDKGNKTLYGKYLEAVDYLKTKGTSVYTALECWNEENGALRSYTLADGVTMQFLYQRYYEEKTSDENDYSVCMLLTQGEIHYLFTGDLEEKGEESLVMYNNLPECELFKGGHHGSPTSSTDALLSVIRPQIVCVCCCCGSTEYTTNLANVFPSQAFVDRVALYTDKVYVTTIISENSKGYQSLNGNIVVTGDKDGVSVNCSNNNTVFKDTEWFKANRTMPDAWKIA